MEEELYHCSKCQQLLSRVSFSTTRDGRRYRWCRGCSADNRQERARLKAAGVCDECGEASADFGKHRTKCGPCYFRLRDESNGLPAGTTEAAYVGQRRRCFYTGVELAGEMRLCARHGGKVAQADPEDLVLVAPIVTRFKGAKTEDEMFEFVRAVADTRK